MFDLSSISDDGTIVYLNEPEIDRNNFYLKNYCKTIRRVNIGPRVRTISDWPNAFCECVNLESFHVNFSNENFTTDCYQQLSIGYDENKTYLIERNCRVDGHFVHKALHTFPAKVKAEALNRLTIDVDAIRTSAFIGYVDADFITLNNVQGWVCPEVKIIGQRVIFITETDALADFLMLKNKIKAISEQRFIYATQQLGSFKGRQYVKDSFDEAFRKANYYIDERFK